MSKKIKSELALGIILAIAIIMGTLVWLESSNVQAEPTGEQYTSTSMTCDDDGSADGLSIVFLGDSITALKDWSSSFKVPCVINAGISGNTTDDVLGRLDAAIISKPSKLFLMIGINDLLRGKDVSYVLKNYETILDRIKLQSPQTIIYIQSVLPINNDFSKIGAVDSQEIISLNEKLKSFANGSSIIFIDLYPFFRGSGNEMNEKYVVDGVHPSSAGYALWKKIITPYVQ